MGSLTLLMRLPRRVLCVFVVQVEWIASLPDGAGRLVYALSRRHSRFQPPMGGESKGACGPSGADDVAAALFFEAGGAVSAGEEDLLGAAFVRADVAAHIEVVPNAQAHFALRPKRHKVLSRRNGQRRVECRGCDSTRFCGGIVLEALIQCGHCLQKSTLPSNLHK